MNSSKELEKRTSPQMYVDYAKEYLDVFELTNQKHRNLVEYLHIKYFLVCRSLELVLKAYLLFAGYSRSQIIKISHDLEKLTLEWINYKLNQQFHY
jgi:hypothetical protein